MNQGTFISRIRSILNDNEGKRWHPAQRYGPALDEPRLALVPAGSRRVFRRPAERLFPEYHVCLMIDASGSMDGSRIEQACVTAHSVHYGLLVSGVKSVKTMAFSNDVWDVSVPSKHDVRKLFSAVTKTSKFGHSTCDYGAVSHGTKVLESKPGGRILCMITDGGSNEPERLKTKVLQARRMGIEVIALGIGCGAYVEEAYGAREAVSVEGSDEIYESLLSLMERRYQRG